MDVLVLLVPLALVLVGAAVWAFGWAARDGQFDDLVSPAARILDEPEETDDLEQSTD
ncbi:MAG: cbb3-type cytochrome oxidase assembly protein CcoS [Bradymonadaceae bacterium]